MPDDQSRKTVKVVVLGDIGRSPRMQYHALSLANCGHNVNLIGYVETLPIPDIQENSLITVTKLYPLKIDSYPKLLQYLLKALWQSISLLLTLFITGNCNYIICQNPPAIPTLPVCRFYCLVTRTKLIIDWHNYAWSIMALSLKENHPLLKLSLFMEKYFGQSSDNNLCVTYAMKRDLIENWNILATVLHDRPPKIFYPITLEEKHAWFNKICQQIEEFKSSDHDLVNVNAFTEEIDHSIRCKSSRPGLLFSSTSWTPDEDFSILMDALQVYEVTCKLTKKLPKLICVVTGKGPMREHYNNQVALRNWENVKVVTPWLEAADYPKMVGSADLGVCLHTSSSGLDLPMKVVDMFGAGLPVCAYYYNCIDELVQNGVNGYTFKNSDELAKHIVEWFECFPSNAKQNAIAEDMRNNLNKFQQSRWEDNWDLRAKKFFK